MSSYVQTTFFTPKDTLPTTNPAKTIFGAAYDVEFGNIAAAILSKYDNTTVAPSLLSLTVGTPTGGNLGAGSINAQSIFVNNTAVLVAGGAVTSITGTANQIAASASTGAVTLSLPQNVIIPTPASGVALTANGVVGTNTAVFGLTQIGDNVALIAGSNIYASGGNSAAWGTSGTGTAEIRTAANQRIFVANSGAVTINAPTSGIALTVNGFANSDTIFVQAPNTSNQSFGLDLLAGTAAADYAVKVRNASATKTFLLLSGDASGGLGPGVSWSVGGAVTIAAPSTSANTLTVNQTTSNNGLQVNSTAGVQASIGIQESGQTSWAIYQPASSNDLRFFGASTDVMTLATGGGAILGAPTGGNQGAGTLNATGLFVNGVDVRAAGSLTGTTLNATVVSSSLTSVGTLSSLAVTGAITSGSQVVGAATGGNQGAGTVNAVNLFIQGVAVSGATTGSFTGTITGVTAGVTPTCHWTKAGTSVTLRIAAWSSTGIANAQGMTGLPAAIQPATAGVTTTACNGGDNGTAGWPEIASVTGGTITYLRDSGTTYGSANFTATGVRSMPETTLVWDVT